MAELKSGVVSPDAMTAEAEQFQFSPGRLAGGFLYVAGQVGVDERGIVPNDRTRQFELAFTNIGTVLATAGYDYRDLISITSFHVSDVPADFDAFLEVKNRYLVKPYPVWTSLGVASLADERMIVEINAVAYREG